MTPLDTDATVDIDAKATGADRAGGATRAAVSLGDLQRAWRAVAAGHFRNASDAPLVDDLISGAGSTWAPSPGERVIPVVGCAGSCGATTVALAIAEAVRGRARVVDCGSAVTSGLAAASSAELGRHSSGWVQGTRGEMLLERAVGRIAGPADVPLPSAPARPVDVTVLDVAWGLEHVMARPSWLASRVKEADPVVVVATPTIPGLRRLETALALLDGTPMVAVVGPPRRRWPNPVAHSLGPLTKALDRAGRVVVIPLDRRLAFAGPEPTALPAPLVAAAERLLQLAGIPQPQGGPA